MTRFNGVHPALIARVTKILDAMEALGFPMLVTDGLRTVEQQQALYAKGRTAPGQIVTYADGVRKRSNHQAHADGYGHAMDLAFSVNGQPSWAEDHPWEVFGAMARAVGLTWGGDFKRLVDRPHVELP
jgi:peptidoglycan L-alanyl-D-glutamate endopeptidase CwlK